MLKHKDGSPPHTWRIPSFDFTSSYPTGITSTYVENTSKNMKYHQLTWDHLHIRGEYQTKQFKTHKIIGSPPHTWRILTASMSPSILAWDHLHIRGEYKQNPPRLCYTLGSPPHTWRIQLNEISKGPLMRITSTYVENTEQTRQGFAIP